MNKEEKDRFTAFCVRVAISCICSVAYAYMAYYAMDSADHIRFCKDFWVDGEDFAQLFQLFEVMVNIIIAYLLWWAGIFFIAVGNAITFCAFNDNVQKKESYISKKEISLTRRVIWYCLAVELILAAIRMPWDSLWVALALYWPMPLFASVPYLWTLKARYKKMNQE